MATPGLPHAPTIKIADDFRPRDSQASGFERTATAARAGGIYHARNLSRVSLGAGAGAGSSRPFSRLSHERRAEFAGLDPEEGDEWSKDPGHKKVVYRGTTLLWLAYQSIGAIYGDIGTSPLYVFSSTFSAGPPAYEDVVQVLSIILWSLVVVVTLKYVIIILHADNEGEGGTFSTYSLLTRYANLTERDPREQVTVKMERHLTQDMDPTTRTLRDKMEKSKFIQNLLKVIGVLAVSMVMSDGILTPAQSVLGAVEGLNVVAPSITNGTVVGVSCAILVVLFAIQPLGLSRLASVFAPVLILWLGFNAGFGIYNLVRHDWTVLKAFNPYYIFEFFLQKKTDGWKMLGGILLAFTGVEALFADLGAFSMRAIQLSWLSYCLPCLVLSYAGQAAFLATHPDQYSNPFFNSVPPGMLYPALIVAILAAIIASQAIITATFQLINQIMKLSYCPQVKVVHTSKTFHGQLYVPFLNWILMGGTILVTAVYNNTTSLGNAYGVCVMFVTFFDTCMVTLVAILVWRFHPLLVALPFLFFASVDGLFLSSALNKVPDGAWFTITVASLLAALFLLWRFGKENQWRAEAEDRIKAHQLLAADAAGQLHLAPRFGGDGLASIRGFGVFFDKTGVLTPAVFTHFVRKLNAVPDVMVFFHLHPVDTPSVPGTERYAVTRFPSIPGCYRLVIRHGFMDEVVSPDLAALIYEQVRTFVIRQAAAREEEEEEEEEQVEEAELETVQPGADAGHGPVREKDGPVETTSAAGPEFGQQQPQQEEEEEHGHRGAGSETTTTTTTAASPAPADSSTGGAATKRPAAAALRDAKTAAELARLDRAFAAKILYVVGKEQMHVRAATGLPRRVLLSVFLWIRENTRAKIGNLRLAMERVVEVGFVKEI